MGRGRRGSQPQDEGSAAPPRSSLPRPIDQNTNVFAEDWMNRCFKEIIYPDPACNKVSY